MLGLAAVEAPRSRGEQWWFVGYALLSFVYRMFIMFLAIFLVAGSSFGVLLACWAILNTIVMPLWRLARQLFTDPQIQARRGGPMPSPRSACWRRPDWRAPCPCRPRPIPRAWSGCRRWPRCAPVAGFVRERQAADDALVAGAPLLALENDELQRRDAMLAAQVDEYQARYVQAHAQNPVQAAITRHQWQSLLTEKRAVDEQVQSQQVRSRHAGRYVSAQPEDMTAATSSAASCWAMLTEAETVRVVVPQSSLERIHRSLEGVRVRLVQDAGREFEARAARSAVGHRRAAQHGAEPAGRRQHRGGSAQVAGRAGQVGGEPVRHGPATAAGRAARLRGRASM